MQRTPELDGLRAISAFAVVFLHVAPTIFPGGSIGVDVFFVLSGFLITKLLLAEQERSGAINLPRFYARRAARLWPALLLMLAAYCAFAVVVKIPADRDAAMAAAAPAGLYYMNWLRAFSLIGENPFGHTWSLAVEEQFYLAWPLALLAILRFSPRCPTVAVGALLFLAVAWRVALMVSGADEYRLYNGFDTRADGLLAGCLLAFVADGSKVYRAAGRTWFAPAIFILAAIVTPRPATPLAQSLWFPVYALAAVWLVAGVVAAKPVGLRLPVLVYLGQISYGIYLWHEPFTREVGYHVHLSPIAQVALISGLSIVAAAASFHFAEVGAKRVGYKLSERLGHTLRRCRGPSGSPSGGGGGGDPSGT